MSTAFWRVTAMRRVEYATAFWRVSAMRKAEYANSVLEGEKNEKG